MKYLFKTTDIPGIFCRLVVGLIFLSEGIQKFLFPAELGPGRFTKIGFHDPAFWAYFTGSFEMVCGTLILLGLFTRLASIPLLIIMLTALLLPNGLSFWIKDFGLWPTNTEQILQ